MAIIRLIRGLSYMDGHIKVTREKPEVSVDDAKVAHYVATGFFEAVNGGSAAEQVPAEGTKADGESEIADGTKLAEVPLDLEESKSAEESNKKDPVDGMSLAELKEYAEKNGIVISGLTKKAEIINAIKEAEKKAAEAREVLRQA